MLMSGCGYKFTSIEDFHKISEVDSKYNRFDINFNGKQFKYKYEQRDCLNDEKGYEEDYDKIQFGNSKLFKTQIKHNIITKDNLIKNEDKDVLLNDDKLFFI